MFGAIFRPLAAGWRRQLWRYGCLACLGVAGAALFWLCRVGPATRATAQTASIPSAPHAAPADSGSDYGSRVVAFVHQNQPITRQELGDYLIARYGLDKLNLLVNKRILDRACQAAGLTVTAAEVQAALDAELKTLAVDRATFLKTVLPRYKKSLFEFEEDVLRPRVQLTRLCQPNVTVTEQDLRKAFESAYGEKVECRVIVWPAAEEQAAQKLYTKLRDDDKAFAEAARAQDNAFASTGGRIKPIARWAMDKNIEDAAFALGSGQVSELIKVEGSIFMLKCDKRIAPDASVRFDEAKAKLTPEIREAKLQIEMGQYFKRLRDAANPQVYLKKDERHATPPPPSHAVAGVYGKEAITREDLGEFLIARMGAEKLGFLVNHRILEIACKQANVTVSDEEVKADFDATLSGLKATDKVFEREVLAKMNKNLFEWREDVLRTRLLLRKLAWPRVTVGEEELKKGFEAYHGEQLVCRMILWPRDQERFARQLYATIRESEAEFHRVAKTQASSSLATDGGLLPAFGRNALGNADLEREAFRLQPGEMTPLVGTPQGFVVLRLERRVPADVTATLEQQRGKLTEEIKKKKTELEMLTVFKELNDKAAPRLLMAGTSQPEDLAAQTRQIMADLPRR